MTSPFTGKFQFELRAELRRIVKTYEVDEREHWLKVKEKPLIPVDIALTSKERLVLIEIESHRQDPSNNIAKILFWLDQSHTNKELLVFQLFSPFYQKHMIKRQISEKLGMLIMERHRGNLTYNSIDFQPKLSFEEFEAIYPDPSGKEELLKNMAACSAKYIVKSL